MPIHLFTKYTLFAFLVAVDNEEPIKLLAVRTLCAFYIGTHIAQDGTTDAISGSFISSLFLMDDPETKQPAAFFAFPDLGIRLTGTLRFKFVLATDSP